MPKTQHSLIVKITLALCISIFLFLTIVAARWAWAEILTIRPANAIKQWEKHDSDYNPEQAILFEQRLLNSLAINTNNANSHLLLARLYEKKLAHLSAPAAAEYAILAEQQFKLAIDKQPTWDYAWARLAGFYSENNATMNNIENALMKAMSLGPYEFSSQLTIIPIIFKHWQYIENNPVLNKPARNIIEQALQHRSTSWFTLDSAKKYQQLALIEPLISDELILTRLLQYKQQLIKQLHKQNDVPNHE